MRGSLIGHSVSFYNSLPGILDEEDRVSSQYICAFIAPFTLVAENERVASQLSFNGGAIPLVLNPMKEQSRVQ